MARSENSQWFIGVFVLVAAGALLAGYVWLKPEDPMQATLTDEPAPSATAPAVPAEPAPPAPEAPADDTATPTDASATSLTAPEPEPLPPLDESDPALRTALLDMALPALSDLLVNDALIRKFVVLVDNLAQGKLAPRYNPLHPPTGPFRVQGKARLSMHPDNVDRYRVYRDILVALDTEQLVRLYWRYYPLMQQAFADLGYPQASFHTRLLTAMDLLIAAPVAPENAALKQPKVLYQYQNPALEQLPPAQKQLMRMGAENQLAVQRKLRALRAALAQ